VVPTVAGQRSRETRHPPAPQPPGGQRLPLALHAVSTKDVGKLEDGSWQRICRVYYPSAAAPTLEDQRHGHQPVESSCKTSLSPRPLSRVVSTARRQRGRADPPAAVHGSLSHNRPVGGQGCPNLDSLCTINSSQSLRIPAGRARLDLSCHLAVLLLLLPGLIDRPDHRPRHRPDRAAASSSPATANRRTTPRRGEGVPGRAVEQSLGPVRRAVSHLSDTPTVPLRQFADQRTYFPACSHGLHR
jgi:hypothetical protein